MKNERRIDRAVTLQHVEHLDETFSCVMPSRSLLRKSLDLSSRYSLSHWDSLLLAGCADADVDRLYSEDLDDGMTYDTVTVINPFR
jgi:predicted nucleic acid-binding protein